MDNPKRIVILGAGFAGIYAYIELHTLIHRHNLDIKITLISDKDYFLFVPLIHEVATGNLLPGSVKQSVRLVPKCCMDNFIVGNIEELDVDSNTVIYKTKHKEEERKEIGFDYLISGLGSDSNFFGVPGAEENTITLKNLDDAKKIKNSLIENFEKANHLVESSEVDDIKDILRIVIIGGGPTGVELAGELSDLIDHELRKAFPKLSGLCEVILVQRGDRLVSNIDPWFSKKICKILGKKGVVKILLNTSVDNIEKNGIQAGNEFINSSTIIWTAGVKAKHIEIKSKLPLEKESRTERIKVTDKLNIANYNNIFVVGDQAWICDKENKQPYPMRAQFATREGIISARNIVNSIKGEKLEEFNWKDQGIILSLGKGGALAEIWGIKFSGAFAWWLYRTAYVAKLIGWRTRIRTVLDWTMNLFLPRDIGKY